LSVKNFEYPKSPVFYRSLGRSFPKIVRGEGCRLFDDEGKSYLDACGGAYVANLGHGVKEIAQAVGRQAAQVAYVNGTAFTTDAAEQLAAEFASLNPKGLDKTYFLGSGSEAVEAALKLARQYWVESGYPDKHKVVALTPGYHGNTLLALSASARGHYKKLFAPWLVPIEFAPAPYPYRRPDDGGKSVEEAILRAGPENVAAFIGEPVGGSSTGASVPSKDYWKNVRKICDRHRVLWIADEVLTGAGRTGKWAAIEHFGATPDVMTFGKGISGGYVPLSAVSTSQKLVDVLAKGSGALKHAQTFSHNPVACAAGVAAIGYLKKHGLIERAAKTGAKLQKALSSLASEPAVGDVRGIGMLACVELVADKRTKAPFPRAARCAERLALIAQDLGLMVWPNVGQADGENGDLVMVAPPFIITDAEIDELVTLLRRAVQLTLDESTKEAY
jgi:adenosylmethionine-8-amino-7-oxononanoate aminotransferase